jgi:hypothetical protein
MPESAGLNQDVQACGTTVQLRSVPGARGEYKATVQDDGTTRVDFRGTPKADITRVSDGAVLRSLPAGGEGSYELYSSDGKQATYSYGGPHVYGAFDETEAKVFASHGLPAVFTYESGTLTERVVFGDREGNRVVSAEIEQNTVTRASRTSAACSMKPWAPRQLHSHIADTDRPAKCPFPADLSDSFGLSFEGPPPFSEKIRVLTTRVPNRVA